MPVFRNFTTAFTLRLSLKRCECASSLSAIADISRLSLSLNCSSENSGPADKSNSMTPLVEHSVAQPTRNRLKGLLNYHVPNCVELSRIRKRLCIQKFGLRTCPTRRIGMIGPFAISAFVLASLTVKGCCKT